MKTKRFLSLLLAMVMSFSLAVPVFAAEPDGPDEGIMPLMKLCDEEFSVGGGDFRTNDFTSAPGYGKYIKVQFDNYADHDATVTLHRSDKYGYLELITVKANSSTDNVIWYECPDEGAVTYYVSIHGKNSYPVRGHLSVLQMHDKTSETDTGATPPSVTLYKNPTVNEQSQGNYTTSRFTSTPGYGPYIKVWYRNDSPNATANVYLWRTDRTSPVRNIRIEPGKSDEIWYPGSNTASVTYYVTISTVNSYPVQGYLAVAQKLSKQD